MDTKAMMTKVEIFIERALSKGAKPEAVQALPALLEIWLRDKKNEEVRNGWVKEEAARAEQPRNESNM